MSASSQNKPRNQKHRVNPPPLLPVPKRSSPLLHTIESSSSVDMLTQHDDPDTAGFMSEEDEDPNRTPRASRAIACSESSRSVLSIRSTYNTNKDLPLPPRRVCSRDIRKLVDAMDRVDSDMTNDIERLKESIKETWEEMETVKELIVARRQGARADNPVDDAT